MKTVVKKWGNSAAIRIPASLMESMGLDLDDLVDLREEHGRIVVEPVRKRVYDLDTLLRGITPENRHEAAEFGRPAGHEVW